MKATIREDGVMIVSEMTDTQMEFMKCAVIDAPREEFNHKSREEIKPQASADSEILSQSRNKGSFSSKLVVYDTNCGSSIFNAQQLRFKASFEGSLCDNDIQELTEMLEVIKREAYQHLNAHSEKTKCALCRNVRYNTKLEKGDKDWVTRPFAANF